MTPMMEQYKQLKAQYPDAILFFRLGDFYEMFFEDAIEGSRLLQLTLTARNKGDHKAPMCGVPYHAAQNYIAKLTKLGKKVALCEQLSDPKLPGIVKRDVVRIITPGTTLDENVLEQKQNNFLGVIHMRSETDASPEGASGSCTFELAYTDVTTGECFSTSLSSEKELITELERLSPAEVIVPKNSAVLLQKFSKLFPRTFFYTFENSAKNASEILIEYLQSTQKTSLQHLRKPQVYEVNDFMPLDEATLKNLELLTTLRENKKEGSLLWVLDKTITSMGGRLLRFFITHPLTHKDQIQQRLDAIEIFVREQKILLDVREVMGSILDLERLLGRLSLGHGNARDLAGLKDSLQTIPGIQKILQTAQASLLQQTLSALDSLPELVDLIERAIVAEPPFSVSEGGMIADGYNIELDELKKISREGKGFIQKLQEEEIERTGIPTLKVRFNSVFGYYIEVSKAQAKNVPQDYIRKQTLVNAERYITPQLKEFEEKVLGAEEKIVALEKKLFEEVRLQVVAQAERIQQTARAVALLDVLSSLAITAIENRYCKPVLGEDGSLKITSGRHPVVEKMSASASFVANDIELDASKKSLILITGPNMGGKSTYLRQMALITLMAHLGSFVPAEKAEISLVDRIFTRVGASDNLIRGQSTFMVEMQETAYILQNATNKSLVILDEIGRGTSTYDGMSIAWAIMEYLHDSIGAKTLFATHYHELISLAEKLPRAANYSVAVKESAEEGVVFLYKILPGGVDRSYGIEVAKLAGLPEEVTAKARQILHDLEEGVVEAGIQKELAEKRLAEGQMGMFCERTPQSLQKNPTLEELKKLDLNSLTPLQALNKLNDFKKKLETDHGG